jgi:hypothetical protein
VEPYDLWCAKEPDGAEDTVERGACGARDREVQAALSTVAVVDGVREHLQLLLRVWCGDVCRSLGFPEREASGGTVLSARVGADVFDDGWLWEWCGDAGDGPVFAEQGVPVSGHFPNCPEQ